VAHNNARNNAASASAAAAEATYCRQSTGSLSRSAFVGRSVGRVGWYARGERLNRFAGGIIMLNAPPFAYVMPIRGSRVRDTCSRVASSSLRKAAVFRNNVLTQVAWLACVMSEAGGL
jgi:hypothetical protein